MHTVSDYERLEDPAAHMVWLTNQYPKPDEVQVYPARVSFDVKLLGQDAPQYAEFAGAVVCPADSTPDIVTAKKAVLTENMRVHVRDAQRPGQFLFRHDNGEVKWHDVEWVKYR